LLLGTTTVNADGTFAASTPIPADLPVGSYTLQANGLEATTLAPLSVTLGLEVVLPEADLVLDATTEELTPAVGDTITITLTVTNRGAGPATNVVIPRAFTEPGFTITDAHPLEGSYHADTNEWKIERIEAGGRARLLLTVVVVPQTTTEEQ
jgi:uncharacterized membrane protein